MVNCTISFLGSSGGLAELKRDYGLPSIFPQGLKVTKTALQVCNRHSKCVGGLPPGTEWGGDTLRELTFIYEDGSQDSGHEVTKCMCRDGDNTFMWFEEFGDSIDED